MIQIGATFPALCHLSLYRTLVSEVDPAFRAPSKALRRHRNRRFVNLGASAMAAAATAAVAASASGSGSAASAGADSSGVESGSGSDEDESDEDGDTGADAARSTLPPATVGVAVSDVAVSTAMAVEAGIVGASAAGPAAAAVPPEPPAAPVGWYEQRRAARKASRAARWASAGLSAIPPHTSAAGWVALLRGLPHGLFSLDVRACSLSYASYALLHEQVAELRAAKVPSPEAAAAAASRRSVKEKEREEKRAAQAVSWYGGGAFFGGQPAVEYDDEM